MATTVAETTQGWVPEDTFGSRLALVRQRMGWNVTEAAEACGLSDESWRQWERGRKPRDYEAVVTKIAVKTGCSRAWLTFGSGEFPLRGERQRPALRAIDGGRTTSGQRALNLQVIK